MKTKKNNRSICQDNDFIMTGLLLQFKFYSVLCIFENNTTSELQKFKFFDLKI